MNKKIKLLSLIATPILLVGGFASLTLVNQCGNKIDSGEWVNTINNIYFRNGVEVTTTAPQILVNGVSVENKCKYTLNKLDNVDLPTGLQLDEQTGVISGIPNISDEVYYQTTNFSITAHYNGRNYTSPAFFIKDGAVGNIYGTDWEGHIQGRLDINFTTGAAIDNIPTDDDNHYRAHNLVIPDYVWDGQIKIRLSKINQSALAAPNLTLTGSLTIGNNITEISSYAFYDKAEPHNSNPHITSLILPPTITTIGENAFGEMGSNEPTFMLILKGFTQAPSNNWDQHSLSRLGALDNSHKVEISGGWEPSLIDQFSPYGLGVDENNDYYNSWSIKYVGSIDGKNWKGYQNVGELLCTKIDGEDAYTITSYSSYTATDLVIPDEVEDEDGNVYPLIRIEPFAFQSSTTLIGALNIPTSFTFIGTHAFDGCANINSISIPSSITTLTGYVFSGCSSITSINIPSSVTRIDQYAFHNCVNVDYIYIPSSVKIIGSYTFGYIGYQMNTAITLIVDGFTDGFPYEWSSHTFWFFADNATDENPHPNIFMSINGMFSSEAYTLLKRDKQLYDTFQCY